MNSLIHTFPGLEHQHVVCALIDLRVGNPLLAHVAAHFVKRGPFVFFQPRLEVVVAEAPMKNFSAPPNFFASASMRAAAISDSISSFVIAIE